MITVVLIGQMDLVGSALAEALGHEADITVLATLSPGEEPIRTIRRHCPAVVVVDLVRYGSGGVALARQLGEETDSCRVLVLARQLAQDVLRLVLGGGAWAVVSNDISPAQLAQFIRQVAGGERVIDPAFARAALGPAVAEPLTERERAVLRLAGAGLRSREIAQRLHLSPGTVRNYVSAAIRKTGARNRLEAVRLAYEEGWL